MKISHFLFLVGVISADYGPVALGRRLGEDVAPIGEKARKRPRPLLPPPVPEQFRFKSVSIEDYVLVPEEQEEEIRQPVPNRRNAMFVKGCTVSFCRHASWYWDGERLRSAYEQVPGWCLAASESLSTRTSTGVSKYLSVIVRQCFFDNNERWKYNEKDKSLCSMAFKKNRCLTVGQELLSSEEGEPEYEAVLKQWTGNDEDHQRFDKIQWPPQFHFKSLSTSHPNYVLVPEELPTSPPINAILVKDSTVPTSTYRPSWYWDWGNSLLSAHEPISGFCLAVPPLSTPDSINVIVKQCDQTFYEMWEYNEDDKSLCSKSVQKKWCLTVGQELSSKEEGEIEYDAVLKYWTGDNEDQLFEQMTWPPA